MAWKKTPPEVVAAFERARPSDPRVQARPMFGYPALFVSGNMFAGTFEEKVVARLPEAERERLLKAKRAAPFEPMPGRPMKEYVVVPASIVAKPKELAAWLERAFANAAALPPKGAKAGGRR